MLPYVDLCVWISERKFEVATAKFVFLKLWYLVYLILLYFRCKKFFSFLLFKGVLYIMGGLLCFYGETVAVNGTRYDVIKSIGEGGKIC